MTSPRHDARHGDRDPAAGCERAADRRSPGPARQPDAGEAVADDARPARRRRPRSAPPRGSGADGGGVLDVRLPPSSSGRMRRRARTASARRGAGSPAPAGRSRRASRGRHAVTAAPAGGRTARSGPTPRPDVEVADRETCSTSAWTVTMTSSRRRAAATPHTGRHRADRHRSARAGDAPGPRCRTAAAIAASWAAAWATWRTCAAKAYCRTSQNDSSSAGSTITVATSPRRHAAPRAGQPGPWRRSSSAWR